MKCYISFETGGTNIRIAIIGQDLQPVYFQKMPTAAFNQNEDTFAFLCSLLDELIERAGKENVLAITSSWASMLDVSCRKLISTPNIKGFDNFLLAEKLEQNYPYPVVVMRDTNALLLYEMRRLPGDHSGIIIAAFLGTGLGNAISIDGKLYHGANGACCELGHIPVKGVEGTCVCGKKGCIEVLCSGKRLLELANSKYKVPVSDIFRLHGNQEDVHNIVKYSAIAIATEITILDPSYMIIGGGVLSIPAFPRDAFEQYIRENLRDPNPRNVARIVYASGDDHAGVVGAAINAENLLFSS